jgi:hypothetical protein
MRDYRDAKAMAQTLRDGLKAQSITISHSNALELIAKTLGCKDWQVLAAKLEADRSASKPTDQSSGAASATSALRCSFCGKTQYEVAKLIAGPDVYICDACVGLCNDIILGQDPLDYARALDALGAKSTDELIALKSKVTARIPQLRQLRALIATAPQATGRKTLSATPEPADPQTAFIFSKSPQERASYAAAIEERLEAIEKVSTTADRLLAERGAPTGSA